MRRKVLLFAAARERAGSAELEIELPAGGRARDVIAAAVAAAPGLEPIAGQLRVALAHAFVSEDAPIGDGELALLPPVSGGSGRIVAEPLSLDRVVSVVRDDRHGGIASFSGVVRDHSDGRRVHRLDYEAYAPMAERVLATIVSELERKHGVRLAVEHRTGTLQVGELAVVIAAGAPHRREALAACAEAIDRIKAELPMWKREHTDAGAEWVDCSAHLHSRSAAD
jgi:molybdopterin synthase catalytic subunit/molybdopterin converting factor small subunit